MRVFVSLIVGAALCVAGCEKRTASTSGDGSRARVVLEVRPPAENAELYIATQAELAKGDAVLEAAAEALGLADKWEQEDAAAAAAKLAPMVTSARVGESALIELVVAAGDETESAEIANAVAKAFAEWAADEEESRVAKRRAELQKQIDEQKEKLEKARVKMLEVMEGYKIVDLGNPAPPWLRGEQGDRGEREKMIEELRTTIGALMDLDGDELIEAAVDLGMENPTLATRYPEFQNLRLAKTQLRSSGLGGKHPKVVAVDRQLSQLEKVLLEAVNLAKGTLQTQLEMAEQNLQNKQKAGAEAAKEKRAKSIEYLDSKGDYEREKQRLMKLREAEVSAPAEPPAVVR